MSSEQIVVTPVPFQEITAIKSDQATGHDFEITIEGEISLNAYCTALIEKVLIIPQSAFAKFINHQCSLVLDPSNWLNRFEKLLSVNENLFFQKGIQSRFTKLYTLIELKREKISDVENTQLRQFKPLERFNSYTFDREYSFRKTKDYCEKLQSFEEKIFYLEDQITEYEQNPPHIVNHNEQDFAKQCQLEITRLNRQHDLKLKLELMQKQDGNVFKPLQVNAEAKSWINVFYQLMHTLGEDGKPILPGPASEVAQHICDCYLQMDGTPFNLQTVRTYLSKGNADGRPKQDKEINLNLGDK